MRFGFSTDDDDDDGNGDGDGTEALEGGSASTPALGTPTDVPAVATAFAPRGEGSVVVAAVPDLPSFELPHIKYEQLSSDSDSDDEIRRIIEKYSAAGTQLAC